MNPDHAFKILTSVQWTEFEREGVFHGAPIDHQDGYIHLSTSDQLEETLSKHFAGQQNLIIAQVDLTVLGNDVRWEEARGGALFPHLYTALPMTAVVSIKGRN